MEGFVVLVVVVMTVVCVFAVVAGQQRRKERAAEFATFAARQGWHHLEEENTLVERWQGKPFTGGGTARNVIRGRHRERDFVAFTYSYTTTQYNGTTTTTQSHDYAVVTIALPGSVAELSVGEEGLFGGKVAEAFGFERVDTGDTHFDEVFKVKSDSPQFAREVLQRPLIDLLKSHGPWEWRFTGSTMLSYEKGKLDVHEVQPRLDRMNEVLDHIPYDVLH